MDQAVQRWQPASACPEPARPHRPLRTPSSSQRSSKKWSLIHSLTHNNDNHDNNDNKGNNDNHDNNVNNDNVNNDNNDTSLTTRGPYVDGTA